MREAVKGMTPVEVVRAERRGGGGGSSGNGGGGDRGDSVKEIPTAQGVETVEF